VRANDRSDLTLTAFTEWCQRRRIELSLQSVCTPIETKGLLEQIGRGLYRWADAPEIDQDLLEVAYRVPRGTLCLVTALTRHGLTDIIQDRIDIAIPRGSRIPTLRPAIDAHVFAKKTFDLGREEVDITDGFAVGLYSAERSLVDVIRLL
jgi:predicted transcriptional regulator of viral defense system